MADNSTFVVIRPRPLFPSEIKKGCQNILSFAKDNEQICLAANKGFEVDKALREFSNQEEVFQIVKPVVDRVWEGYQATVLAYGQTGAGKTYTMGTGKGSTNSVAESKGIVPRIVQAMFQEAGNASHVEMTVSFMEVYNEEVYDLLAAVPTKLQIKGFKVQNLTEIAVHSESDALLKLDEGIEGRRFCATQANSNSSRSHAIFSFHIRRSSSNSNVLSTLHLVDLAGSESVRKTGNQGVAFLEGININKGLLSLGKVIAARSLKQQGHVPFRDSVLTSVLKDSLCGNSFMAVIACISPCDTDLPETLNTLRFVQRARKITNQPKINQVVNENADKLKNFQHLLKTIPPTPAHWNYASLAGRSVRETPGSQQRKPLCIVNYSLPSPMTARYTDSNHQSFMSARCSPTSSLSDLTEFEPPRCSSSLNYTATRLNDEYDISTMVNSLFSERMEEILSQTEEIIERKVQDTLRKMRSTRVAPLTSQLHKLEDVSIIPHNNESCSNLLETDKMLSKVPSIDTSIKCKLFVTPVTKCQTSEKRVSPRLAAQKTLDTNITFTRETQNSAHDSFNFTDITIQQVAAQNKQQSPDCVVAPKRRKSIRIQEMHAIETSPPEEKYDFKILKPKRRCSLRIEEMQSNFNPMTSVESSVGTSPLKQKVSPKLRRRSSLSLNKSLKVNTTLTQHTSPNMEEFMNGFAPRIKRRYTMAKCLTDCGQQTSPDFIIQVPKKVARRSMASTSASSTGPIRINNRNLLEEKLAVSSPASGNVQEKHNLNILRLLNSENLRGLQQLPTIGPKTAFIIFNYRKLNGPFTNIGSLQQVPGLPKTYCNRFAKANNVTL